MTLRKSKNDALNNVYTKYTIFFSCNGVQTSSYIACQTRELNRLKFVRIRPCTFIASIVRINYKDEISLTNLTNQMRGKP